MNGFRKWCYDALPVIGFLTIWFGCFYLDKTYFGDGIVGGFIGFLLGGWILTYKDEIEHEEKIQKTREELLQEYQNLTKEDKKD